jgi:hypothetical protein
VELLVIVLFVKIKTVRQHLFNIADLDGHVGTEHATINFNSCRVDIVKRPNP